MEGNKYTFSEELEKQILIPLMKQIDLQKHARVRLLIYLARNGRDYYTNLYEKGPFQKGGTLQRAIRHLLEEDLIRLVKNGEGGKKIYDLTQIGLFVALAFQPSWRYIDEIADKQKDKLPFFKHWEYLMDKGLRHEVLKLLYYFVFNKVKPRVKYSRKTKSFFLFMPVSYYYMGPYIVAPFISHLLTLADTDFQQDVNAKTKRWVETLMGKEDLKLCLEEHLENCEKRFQKALTNVRLWKKLLKNLKKDI